MTDPDDDDDGPSSEDERSDGEWHQNDDGTWYFEVDFGKCLAGHHAVLFGFDEKANREYVVVAKIEEVHKDKKSFTAKLYTCPADIFSSACLSAAWTSANLREEYENYTVVMYFKTLNYGGKLPKVVVDRVKSNKTFT